MNVENTMGKAQVTDKSPLGITGDNFVICKGHSGDNPQDRRKRLMMNIQFLRVFPIWGLWKEDDF